MYRIITFLLLLALAVAVAARRDETLALAGYKPLKPISAEGIDDPTAFDERAAPRFFADRNQLELVVPRDMTLVELLRLYQVDFPHIRRQIAEQKNVPALADGDRLTREERFVVSLTPPADGQP